MIRLERISKTYSRDGAPVTALRDASFAIGAGEFVVIRGVSGSGKSTLLNILGCLDSPTSGAYLLDGADVSHKERRGIVAHSFAEDRVHLPIVQSASANNCGRECRAAHDLRGSGRQPFTGRTGSGARRARPPRTSLSLQSFPAANSSGSPLPDR